MDTKEILYSLRTQNGLSQDELAEKVFVTRQAVSRWETGETTPNVETLKRLSRLYDVSINTLLGAPRQLICQCCGMPLEDSTTSREPDGTFNEEYCKWCYTDGEFKYTSKEQPSSSAWRTWQAKAGLRSRSGRTWRQLCRSLHTGRNNKTPVRGIHGQASAC